MREIIENFILNPNRTTIPLHVNYLGFYQKMLEDNDFEMEELGETNGWSVDFWYYFKHKYTDIRLCLAGSLWYGDYTLSKVQK